MLFVHEVHTIAGGTADEFEAAYREGWLPALAGTDGARLLWYLHQAHGTGPAYRVVTVTAVASTDALGATWSSAPRRAVSASGGTPSTRCATTWRPRCSSRCRGRRCKRSSLTTVPTSSKHRSTCSWRTRRGRSTGLDDYLEQAGTLYVDTLARSAAAGRAILELVGAFQPVFGTGRHREVVLWQRVTRNDALVPLLTREVPAKPRPAGTCACISTLGLPRPVGEPPAPHHRLVAPQLRSQAERETLSA